MSDFELPDPSQLFDQARLGHLGNLARRDALIRQLEKVECSFEGIRTLEKIAIQVAQEHLVILEMDTRITKGVISDKGLDWEDVFTFVVSNLTYGNLELSNVEFLDLAIKELKAFIGFISNLWEQKDANGNPPPLLHIFTSVMMDLSISDQWIWHMRSEQFNLVRKKALKIKKTCHSHHNRLTSFAELSDEVKRALDEEYLKIFDLLDSIISPPFVQARKQEVGSSSGVKLRKNHHVWLPIMIALESAFVPFFRTKKHWEQPGGFPQKAVPAKVYEAINGILYFCYPHIWSLNPSTTSSIKARCQNARLKSS